MGPRVRARWLPRPPSHPPGQLRLVLGRQWWKLLERYVDDGRRIEPSIGDPFASAPWALRLSFRGEVALEAAAVHPVFALVGGPRFAADGPRLRGVDVVVTDDTCAQPRVPIVVPAGTAEVGLGGNRFGWSARCSLGWG